MNRRSSTIASFLVMSGCAEPRHHSMSAPPIAPSLSAATEREKPAASAHQAPWGVPTFFEIGTAVQLSAGGDPVDTTPWLAMVTRREDAEAGQHFGAWLDRGTEFLVYSEPVGPHPRRFALRLPKTRSSASNGWIDTHWNARGGAFSFAPEGSRTFGSLIRRNPTGLPSVLRLQGQIVGSGSLAQEQEQVYRVEGENLALFEHKGIVPHHPVTFERVTLYDPSKTQASEEPQPVQTHEVTLQVGLLPAEASQDWSSVEIFEIASHSVLWGKIDGDTDYTFLATPVAARPVWRSGSVTADLLAVAGSEVPGSHSVRWLELTDPSSATLLTGHAENTQQLEAHLHAATSFLSDFDRAWLDFKARGPKSLLFLSTYVRSFLDRHRSAVDPRALTALPFGDASTAADIEDGSARHASDQAIAILGLIHYVRRTGDRRVLEQIWSLTEASMEGMAPSGSVWRKRFNHLSMRSEADSRSGRADAFIDNGGIAVAFNHEHLSFWRGGERLPGSTWGLPELSVDGRTTQVNASDYRFSVDELPTTVSPTQSVLEVVRSFTESHGALAVREHVHLERGIPSARIMYTIENTGGTAVTIDEVALTLADFLHHGDGTNAVSQNRYGLSRVIEGVPSSVGFWMEGMDAPLWGENVAEGWSDVTDTYVRTGARFFAVFGYDKAQLFYLPQRADKISLYRATRRGEGGSSDAGSLPLAPSSYHGWTRLQVRYAGPGHLAPHGSSSLSPVETYTLRAPLHSLDEDTIPDVLQVVGPRWVDLVTGKNPELRFTALETDTAYVESQAAWAAASDLFEEIARDRAEPAREPWAQRAALTRDNALRGARFSLHTLEHLRNRPDLMPVYGTARQYGFHIPVFDWAYRQTCDHRFRDAMISVADRIAGSVTRGGLQVTDPAAPNYGGFMAHEQAHASGANALDDQGIKLWALRIAYGRTGASRYRRAAARFTDHWIRVRDDDHRFYGTTKYFDRYQETGPEQQDNPFGHYSLMVGLRAWSDRLPQARQLYARGLRHATDRHGVHGLGPSGPFRSSSPKKGRVDFASDAALGGMFLWALTDTLESRPTQRASACGRP